MLKSDGIAKDIGQSEYADMMKELEIYKSFLNSTIDQGIMICDANHKVLIYNRPASVKLDDDTPEGMVVGQKYEDVFPHPETSNLLKVLKTGMPILNSKNIYFTPGGKTVISFGSTYPIKKDGITIAAASIIRWNSDIIPLLTNILEFQNQFFSQRSMHNNTRYTFTNIIGKSPSIQEAIQKSKKAAAFVAMPILIYGETGTGKELFAQSIHNTGPNKEHPFVALNCAAVPESLLEITLFGSVRGAFTDAQDTAGLLEQAGKGTLFLDEINSMPLSLQSKILRVLQEKTFRKLGSSKEQEIQCRIITSTNVSPRECIAGRLLREDLFYRISTIFIEIPPLRERKEDIELLANYFIQKYSSTYGIEPVIMPEKYLDLLKAHSWPGNVRELQNTVESSLVMLEPDNGVISPQIWASHNELVTHAPPVCRQTAQPESQRRNLKDSLATVEKEIILEALGNSAWNVSKAAKAIGLSRSNLQYRMEKLGLFPPDES